MNWLLDIIIAAILIVGIVLGWRRGFIKTAVIATSGILSLLVALLLTKPCSVIFGWLDFPTALIRIITFILLYIVMKVVLRLMASILTKLFDVPFLRKLNKWMGVILSLIIAIVRVLIFCLVMNVLFDAADFLNLGLFDSLEAGNSILFSFFSKFDLFSFIF